MYIFLFKKLSPLWEWGLRGEGGVIKSTISYLLTLQILQTKFDLDWPSFGQVIFELIMQTNDEGQGMRTDFNRHPSDK